jgi:hypothetical protein
MPGWSRNSAALEAHGLPCTGPSLLLLMLLLLLKDD